MAACNHAVHIYAGAKGRPIAGKKAIPNPPQKLLYNMVLLWVNTLYTQQSCTPGYTTTEMSKKKQALDLQGLALGGDSWTRTNDPIDVNDVLYRLSHATMFRLPGSLLKWPAGTHYVVKTSNRFGKPLKPLISKDLRVTGVRRYPSKRNAFCSTYQVAFPCRSHPVGHNSLPPQMWTGCLRWT